MKNEFYNLLVEESPDAMIVASPEGKLLYWNQGAENIFGYAASETEGRFLSDLIVPESRLEEEAAVQRKARQTGSVVYDALRKRKDGSLLYMNITLSVVRDSQGRRELLAFNKKDITHLKALWDSKSAEGRYLAILDSTPDAILMVNDTGRIVLVNGRAETMFGWKRKELLGQTVEVLLPERFRGGHVKHRANYFHEPGVRPMGVGLELFGLNKQGNEFPVEISLSPLEAEEGSIVIAAVRDITDKKLAQAAIERLNQDLEHRVEIRTAQLQSSNERLAAEIDQRREAEAEARSLNKELETRVRERTAELEAANKDLNTFSYSVSHDLRAPLRGIHGYVRMLEEDCAGALDVEGKRLLGVVSSEAERMGNLIDDLLAFARLGRQNLKAVEIDMAQMANSVVESLTAAKPDAASAIRLKPMPAAWGDPAMLRQVFENLLGNAFKFTRQEANPTIEVGGWSDHEGLTYYVKDNGVGFDEKYAHKLFGVFQRLHGEEEFEGTGVGLAIIQQVIQRHQGKVWAKGTPNQGAEFFFRLPNPGTPV